MAGPIRIAILANGKPARNAATLTARAYGGMGRTIARSGAALGLTGLVAGTVGLAKASISTEAVFSQRMNMLAAATKAPAGEIRTLNDLAIKLGADTSFSANEAADGMLELGRAGQSTEQIIASIPEVLNLAATEGIDLATAAGVVTSGLAQFSLGADKSSRVVNALAGASNASRSSVTSLGESLKLSGSAAAGVGLTVEETAGALAALSQSGLDGSVAGTSLSAVFNRLIPTTERASTAMDDLHLNFVKADGSFKNIDEIAQDLQTSLGGLSDSERKLRIQDMFGNDASTIAAVNALVKAGGKGLRDYTKAAQDNNAAQDLAKSRMDGTAGALDRLGGAVETAQLRIGQELAPVTEAAADGLSKNLVPAIDTVVDGAKDIGRAVAPAVKELATAIGDLIPSGNEAGSMFQDQFLPTLRTLADLTADVVGFVNDLPDPIKDVGIQAGIAALVLPRLAGAATAAGTAMRNASTYARVLSLELRDSTARASLAQSAVTKLGGAAQTAAGIGGMVALAQGAEQSDKKMGALLTTLGGAATGFALGGPIGALIGGAGGGLLGIVNATRKADRATEEITGRYADLRSTLDEVTGATTSATRAYVYDELVRQRAMTGLLAEGINRRTAVDAVLGEKSARDQVSAALDRQQAKYDQATAKLKALGEELQTVSQSSDYSPERVDAITKESEAWAKVRDFSKAAVDGITSGYSALQEETAAQKARADAVTDYGALLDGVRAKARRPIVSYLEVNGVPRSAKAVARMQAQLGLTPKRVTTVLEALGVDVNRRRVRELVKEFNAAGRTRVTLPGVSRGVDDAVQGAEKAARRGAGRIDKGVTDPLKRTRANMPQLGPSIDTAVSGARAKASAGGQGIGSALGAGTYRGIDSWASAIATRAASMVSAAIASAKRAGDINSPSGETEYLGRMLGTGLADGMERTSDRNRQAGRNIVRELLAGVVNGSEGVEGSLGKLSDFIDRSFDQKLKARKKELRERLKGRALEKAEDRAERSNAKARNATIKSLAAQRKALGENGRAQDRLQSGNYLGTLAKGSKLWVQMTKLGVKNLDEAAQKYQELVDQQRQYAAGIKEQFTSYGSLGALGEGDGFANSEQMLSQLRAREAKAQQYAQMIRQLQAAGLSQANIDDLLAKGVDGGYGTAQTLLAGGAGVIREVNQLTASIAKTGGDLGAQLGQTFYGSGVQAAKGLVDGLRGKQAALDRAAVQMANALAKAVKKALGIKSPSRVFMGIGDNVTKGLGIGLDETYVKRQGARLAGSLEQGFGSPALTAYRDAAAGASAASGGQQLLEVRLTAEQTSDLQMGKTLMAKIDVARGAGNKWTAVP